ncbi:MAG TPA: hypothetical protein VLF43_05340 [Candidatus Saccharimonadales bacterium]|nr:hypothetical protein [Candidatus Saccharimonadales bacterium]
MVKPNPNNHENKRSLVEGDPLVAGRVGLLLASENEIAHLTIMNGHAPETAAVNSEQLAAQVAADRAAMLAQTSLTGAEVAEG